MPRHHSDVFAVLGNQLFPVDRLAAHRSASFFMAEDLELCTYVRHHKQKLLLFLTAMREYRAALESEGFSVTYAALDDEGSSDSRLEDKLARHLKETNAQRLILWEVEDKWYEQRLRALAEDCGVSLCFLPSPMFLTPRRLFADFEADNAPHMATFYRFQRKRLGLLLEEDGERPRGGRWSFDEDNRKALPNDVALPELAPPPRSSHEDDVRRLIEARFPDHPGRLPDGDFWLPTNRQAALTWLDDFLEQRLGHFGPYEDALSTRGPFLFHSVLTPALNLGLLTPQEVIDRAFSREGSIPLQSLEGFVRQVIGWREFIRGIYQGHSEQQEQQNFFQHTRKLTPSWHTGETGVAPLDDVIHKALRWGWTHHIERLMVLGNLMTLCEIEPQEAHRYFMELFVDSSDWVMGPNVYGMALFADGGLFATKPYICGSNYLLKMSDYRKPRGDDSWADVVDGLYWRFVDKHRDFFKQQARMPFAVSTFDRMGGARKRRILQAAEDFLDQHTCS